MPNRPAGTQLFSAATVAHFRNPGAQARPSIAGDILPAGMMDDAANEISQWPDYAPSPVVSLPGLARACGVAAVDCKDESGRFGLGSFKALGGPFALQRALAESSQPPDAQTVAAATDGNHGRALAWGAKRFGCRCVVYIHAEVSENRADAMRELGARIVRVNGDYDDSARRAESDAAKNGWLLVADTSPDPRNIAARRIMAGYAALFAEVRAQLSAPPSHVFVPAGVGGLAAALVADFARANLNPRPRIVVVESDRADCLLQSAKNGKPTAVKIQRETMMAGLSCGEPSAPAWEIVSQGADDFVAIPDELVAPCMREAAAGTGGDPSLTAGECGVAGWAALRAAANQPRLFRALGLSENSRVLLIATEGATDADIYRKLTAPQDGGGC